MVNAICWLVENHVSLQLYLLCCVLGFRVGIGPGKALCKDVNLRELEVWMRHFILVTEVGHYVCFLTLVVCCRTYLLTEWCF